MSLSVTASRTLKQNPTLEEFRNYRDGMRHLVADRPSDLLLYTADEAAALLRVTPETLFNWRRKGIGPRYVRPNGTKSTRRVVYRECDLRDFIESSLVETTGTVSSDGDIADKNAGRHKAAGKSNR